ncbi:hypothetical protein C3L33_10101, partial [Rhododendron williamsianum]
MGERKVLNKYYPPDFDPAKIPRRRQLKNQQMKDEALHCGAVVSLVVEALVYCSRSASAFILATVKKEQSTMTRKIQAPGLSTFLYWSRQATVSVDAMLEALQRSAEDKKRRKVSEEPALNPTDCLAKTSDSSKNEGRLSFLIDLDTKARGFSAPKHIFKSSLVRVSVVRKPSSASNSNGPANQSRQATVSVDAMLEALQRSAEDKILQIAALSNLDLKLTLSEIQFDPFKKQGASLAPKHIFKSSLVRVSVVRKPSSASNSNGPANQASKPTEEHKTNATGTGLLSLCQNYESDEDD